MHTLIDHVYNEATHSYSVTIGTDIGQFSGTVMCRPEDYQFEASYFGYELAELKAMVQYARAKRDFYNAQIAALARFWREMSSTRTYDTNAFWVKKIKLRLDELAEERDIWVHKITAIRDIYHTRITQTDTVNARRRAKEGR